MNVDLLTVKAHVVVIMSSQFEKFLVSGTRSNRFVFTESEIKYDKME